MFQLKPSKSYICILKMLSHGHITIPTGRIFLKVTSGVTKLTGHDSFRGRRSDLDTRKELPYRVGGMQFRFAFNPRSNREVNDIKGFRLAPYYEARALAWRGTTP